MSLIFSRCNGMWVKFDQDVMNLCSYFDFCSGDVVGWWWATWEKGRGIGAESVGMLWSLVAVLEAEGEEEGRMGRGKGGRRPQSRPGGQARRPEGRRDALRWVNWEDAVASSGEERMDWDALRQWMEMQWASLQSTDQVLLYPLSGRRKSKNIIQGWNG